MIPIGELARLSVNSPTIHGLLHHLLKQLKELPANVVTLSECMEGS